MYISTKADEIFERFKRKHNLSESEARRLIALLHDKASIDELKRLLDSSDIKSASIVAELESVAYQARLERLRQLQNEIDLVMKNIYQQERDFTTSFYTDLANESYYKTMFDLQQRIGVGFSFNHISQKQINKVLSMDWSGLNYSKRIWKNTQGLAKDLKEELLINLLTGRTNREVSEIIANKFASGASKARRLVRTESNFVSSELNFESYKEAGIEEYQFLATLDLKTSKVCRELDGKIFKVSERKVGVNCNPMHPWCRSTTISVVDRKYIDKMTRSARDPVTGKIIKVPRSMSYQQWYDKFVKGNSQAEANEKKIRNKSADKKQYQKYREILGKDAPKSLEEFQNMKYNDGEKWNVLQKRKNTYSDIDSRNWSDDFKLKSKEAYNRFEKEGEILSVHALSRLQRLNKTGFPEISEQELLQLVKKNPNYLEGEEKLIFFDSDKQIMAVKNRNTGYIVSIVRRKNPKKEWKNV
jgi:SPP1 gp7 family putative phage head morphogenesis protein